MIPINNKLKVKYEYLEDSTGVPDKIASVINLIFEAMLLKVHNLKDSEEDNLY